ncbi:hypothetical protein K3495_g10081 [Podosphaera aphanis]|nr:hypothetical protein K3495_g10081 [Podosphaera aphanis]
MMEKTPIENEILEIDDGLPPANNETYTVNIDNMLDNKKINEPSQRLDEQGFNAGFGNDLIQLCNELGISFEPTVKGTPEQNGPAERAGGTLTMKARVMRIHGNLPKSLANELFKTARYILNRTPTQFLNWKTPYEMVWERKPLVSHMRPIGYQAFTLNQHILKGDKTASRALIGHLVRYQGTNIFRIWLPNKDDVIVTRDVVFEPTIFYTGTQKYAADSVIKQTIELLEYPERLDDGFIQIEDLLTRRQRWSELSIKSEVEPVTQKLGSVLLETREDSELVNSRHDLTKKGSSNEEI